MWDVGSRAERPPTPARNVECVDGERAVFEISDDAVSPGLAFQNVMEGSGFRS
jgi:hypothetical protein